MPKTDAESIVADPETGLMWPRDDNGQDIDWHGADEYAQNLELAGYSDWRLPTIDELEEIYGQNSVTGKLNFVGADYDYDIQTIEGFQLTAPFIWSSTKKGSDLAWNFNFYGGGRTPFPLRSSFVLRALCVRRSGQ